MEVEYSIYYKNDLIYSIIYFNNFYDKYLDSLLESENKNEYHKLQKKVCYKHLLNVPFIKEYLEYNNLLNKNIKLKLLRKIDYNIISY